MAFEKLREAKPARSTKCAYCKDADKEGVVSLAIKDKDVKTVTSRQYGACEACAIEQYEKLLTSMTPRSQK